MHAESDRIHLEHGAGAFRRQRPAAGRLGCHAGEAHHQVPPGKGSGRGKTLPLTITMPHGCNLKDQTEEERMIGDKYLRRWGIVQDV